MWWRLRPYVMQVRRRVGHQPDGPRCTARRPRRQREHRAAAAAARCISAARYRRDAATTLGAAPYTYSTFSTYYILTLTIFLRWLY